MPYFVRIPKRPGSPASELDTEHYLNIINGDGTLIQRELRRRGYGGYEPVTAATMCAVFDKLDRNEIFSRSSPDHFGFYDVGANGGLYSFLCKCLFRERAEVTAFEPAPDTYRWLSAINEANLLGIATEPVAVSDNTEDVTLYLSQKSDASNSLNKDFKTAHKGAVTVGCVTLDGYIANSGRCPDFLKIDTETHEDNVIRGGGDFIREHRPVLIVEALKKGRIDYGTRISQCLDEIGGYQYYRLGPDFCLTHHDKIETEECTDYRDWLITPTELPDDFLQCVRDWGETLRECGVETNVSKSAKRNLKLAVSSPRHTRSTAQPIGLLRRLQAAAKAFSGANDP